MGIIGIIQTWFLFPIAGSLCFLKKLCFTVTHVLRPAFPSSINFISWRFIYNINFQILACLRMYNAWCWGNKGMISLAELVGLSCVLLKKKYTVQSTCLFINTNWHPLSFVFIYWWIKISQISQIADLKQLMSSLNFRLWRKTNLRFKC